MAPWQQIDDASEQDARALLQPCCGARAWVNAMLARRPFGSTARLLEAARESWWSLSADDWREAFAQHPKIGERAPADPAAAREQAGVASASSDLLSDLATANGEYEARFGYIFIVCATGKSAPEMLALLQQRLRNDPDRELRVAAGEQAKITERRLFSHNADRA